MQQDKALIFFPDTLSAETSVAVRRRSPCDHMQRDRSGRPTAIAATTFVVEGEGDFPLDMLRQEQCWPARRRDATAIAMKPKQEGAASFRQVVLASHNRKAPSLVRWRRKGWLVII
jgi:hypothetical protein